MFAQAQDDPSVESPTGEVEEGALRLWEAFLEAIPRIGIAVTFVIAGALVAYALRRLLAGYWRRRDHSESFARVMSKLVSYIVLGAFALAAITVTFPSVKPVDLLAGLGFFSIAIGFAFQDILENALSGVLLLFREPFQAGDQIDVEGATGTVEGITIRETRISTFDGRSIVVPNADVYKNAIVVGTANELRRDEFVVGIAYEADTDEACDLIFEALASVDGVSDEKEPEALVTELGASTVNVAARYWTGSPQHNVVTVRSEAIKAVKRTLEEAGIELPCDIVALQGTDSFKAAIQGEAEVTPGGSLAA